MPVVGNLAELEGGGYLAGREGRGYLAGSEGGGYLYIVGRVGGG